MQSSTAGQLQVFFDRSGHFSEGQSRWYPLQAGQRLDVSLEQVGARLAQLRIDPPSGAEVSMCGLELQLGRARYGYAPGAAYGAGLQENGQCLLLSSAADAADPQVVVAARGQMQASLATAARWERIYRGVRYAGLLYGVCLLVGLRWLWLAPFKHVRRLAWMERLDAKAHWIAIALMLSFGSLYALHTPPGAVPDEPAHLAKIVKIRQGAFFGGQPDQQFPDLWPMYGPFSNYLGNKQPFTEQQLAQQLAQPLSCTPATTALPAGADPYFPHHYALATATYMATCAAHGSFGTFLYPARLLNLLLATLLVGLGVAFAGRAKWPLLFIAVLPMSLSQMASLSADSLVIALSIGWIGVTSGLAAGSVSLRRVLPLLWVMAIAIGLLKPGAAWILASLLFCRDAFRQARMSFVRGVLGLLVLPWLLHLLLIGSFDATGITREGVDPAMNAQRLLHEPGRFVYLLWKTLAGDYGKHLYTMMVGILGWIDVPLSAWSYRLAGYALLATLFMAGNRGDCLRTREVVPAALVMVAGSVALIALPLYVQWTAADAPIVEGLQGRYFLPSLAFAWAYLSLRSPDPIRAGLLVFVLGTAAALNVDALDHLHQAYFVAGR